MTIRSTKLVTLAALAALASGTFAATSAHAAALDDHGKSHDQPSSSGDRGDEAEQGVAQSVSSNTILVKSLDGNVVSMPVDSTTRIYVGDKTANLGDIKPGYVVTGTWTHGNAADEVRAVNPSPRPSVSIVASVRTDRIVVTGPDGSSMTIRVSEKTREFVDGKRARLRDVKPGYTLLTAGVSGSKEGKAADELRFGKR
jgi:hypothetical protein